MLDHYRHVRDSVGLPLWVYNIPMTVKTAVAPGTIATLAAEGTVVGVKDSSGAGELLAQLNILCDQGEISLLRFLGTVFRITNASAVGVHGVIPGIANLVPGVCARGWEAGEAGDTGTVRESNALLLKAQKIGAVAQGGGANAASFGGMKSALKHMGVIDHDTTVPTLPSPDGRGEVSDSTNLGRTGTGLMKVIDSALAKVLPKRYSQYAQ